MSKAIETLTPEDKATLRDIFAGDVDADIAAVRERLEVVEDDLPGKADAEGLSVVATSGRYRDLANLPDLSTAGLVRYAPGLGQGDLVEIYNVVSGSCQWLATDEIGADGFLIGYETAVADVGPSPARVQLIVVRQVERSDDPVGTVADWQELGTFEEPAASLGVSAGATSKFLMMFSAPIMVQRGDRIGFIARIVTASGEPVMFGAGNGRLPDGTPPFFKGGFSGAIGTAFSNVTEGFHIYGRALVRALRTQPRTAGLVTAYSRRFSGDMWGLAFRRVSFNCLVEQAARYEALVTRIGSVAGATTLKLFATRRPAAIKGSIYEAGSYRIGTDGADVRLFSTTIAISDVYERRYASAAQDVVLPFPHAIEVNPGELLMITAIALAADGNTLATMDLVQAAGFAPRRLAIEKGSYTTAAVSDELLTLGDASVGFKLLGELIEQPKTKRLCDAPIATGSIPSRVAGLSLALPAINLDGLDRPRGLLAQTLTFESVGSAAIITQSLSLRYNESNPLKARRWAAVTVRRAVGNALLVEGVDYALDAMGTIVGLVAGDPIPVNIEIAAYKMRVDTVLAVPFSESYQIAKGVARYSDADNWMVDPISYGPAGRIEICRVLVTNGGLEVLDRTGATPGALLFAEDDDYLRAIKAHNRPLLRRFHAELAKGAAANITLISYGDSNGANGGGYETIGSVNYQVTPGGPSRDRREHWTDQTSDECFTDPTCPVYAPLLDGDAGPALHAHASMHWRAAKIISDAYGCPIAVKTLAVGGTTSASTGAGTESSRYNGAAKSRLDAVYAARGSGVTVVPFGFGTNDADDENLINNISAIARDFAGRGLLPVVLGQPEITGNRSTMFMKRQEARMMRAAMTAPAVFVPFSAIQYDRKNRGILFPSLENGAGGVNHPGLWWHMQAGRLIAELLMP